MEKHYGLTGTSDGQCDSHSSDLCTISRQWNNILSSPFPHTVLEQPFFSFFLFVASGKHESAERILLTSGYSQVGLNQYDTV